MKLDDPLYGVIKRCETLCEATCCGRDAYDFSPIHIASFLLRHSEHADGDEVTRLREQVHAIKVESARLLDEDETVSIMEMNQTFSAQSFADLAATLETGLDRALELIQMAYRMR